MEYLGTIPLWDLLFALKNVVGEPGRVGVAQEVPMPEASKVRLNAVTDPVWCGPG